MQVTLRRILFATTLVLVAASGPVVAQNRPDFSGAWEHPARGTVPASQWLSRFPHPAEVAIVQDEAELRVTDVHGYGGEELAFRLDGSESSNTTTGDQRVSTSRWVGNALIVTSVASREGEAPREFVSIYALGSEGRLTITTIDSSSRFGNTASVTTTTYRRAQDGE